MKRSRFLLGVGAAVVATALPGCGFALRRPPVLPFARITLAGFVPRSSLAEELRALLLTQVQVVDAPAPADVVLVALLDKRERSVVASTAVGQVRELQLRLRLEFKVQTPSGRELLPRAELALKRDLSYSESAALAKEYEEAQLFREMQSDVVVQVLRRLASVKL